MCVECCAVERIASVSGGRYAKLLRLLPLALAYCAATMAEPGEIRLAPMDAWILPRAANELRWLNVIETGPDGILHVEVLGRAPRAKPWTVRHLAAHLAITPEALQASVLKYGSYGSVYPESYYWAKKNWDALAEQGKAPVCTTSVMECLNQVR